MSQSEADLAARYQEKSSGKITLEQARLMLSEMKSLER